MRSPSSTPILAVAACAGASLTACAGAAASARAHDAMAAELRALDHQGPALHHLEPSSRDAVSPGAGPDPGPSRRAPAGSLADGADLALGASALERARLVGAVLARNPDLDAAREGWRAATAAYAPAVALADPRLTYEVAPVSIASDVAFGERIELAQRLPYPGKRAAAGDAAVADAEAARADYRALRLQLAEAAVGAFDDYYVATRALEVNAHHRAMVERIHASAIAQYAVGRAGQQDPLEAEAEIIALDRERLMLDTQHRAATAQINRLLHRPPEAPLPPPPPHLEVGAGIADAPPVATAPTADGPPAAAAAPAANVPTAAAATAANVPPAAEVPPAAAAPTTAPIADATPGTAAKADARGGVDLTAAARARIQARTAELAAAERAPYPDIELMTAYDSMFADREHRFTVGVAIELPLWRDGRRASVERARAELARATAELASITSTLDADRDRAHREVDEAAAALELHERRAVPNARARVDAALAGFAAGQTAFSTVMNAERTLREAELSLERARADLDRRGAALDRLLGRIPGGAR